MNLKFVNVLNFCTIYSNNRDAFQDGLKLKSRQNCSSKFT
jgi:hypothetical protein